MSLLLDARRKSKQAQAAQPEAGTGPDMTTPQAADQARNAGHNLFAAKFLRIPGGALPNRNLLYALGGTILLIAGGMAYLWYLDSASNTTPLRPISAPPTSQVRQAPPIATTEPVIQHAPTAAGNAPAPADTPGTEQFSATPPAKSAPTAEPQSRIRAPARHEPIRIEPKKTVPVDPLLSDAYLAYSNGSLDEARRLYLTRLENDARNPDVLLGLAAIAQQRGEPKEAAQYFGRVLALDPRNALANAGMSALSADEDYSESRLKILLREQGNSAALHFALGNLYAGQSRWGEAQQAYFNAYTLEPGKAEYAFNLAVSLDHLGQNKLAAQHYQRAMQLDLSRSAGFDHAQISQRAQELAR